MNRIRQLREEKGMTQVRLSIELSVSQETISAYESGKHFPNVSNLIRLSELFNASCDYILGLSDIRCIQKGGEYSAEEIDTVSRLRLLTPTERKMVRAYIQGISDKSHMK